MKQFWGLILCIILASTTKAQTIPQAYFMTTQNKLEIAANGLLMMSESDYPFDFIQTNESRLSDELALQLADKPTGTLVEQVTIEHLFRNLANPETHSVNAETVKRFQNLMNTLKQELHDITVYRVGEIQVHVLILGYTADGTIAGMRTLLIET